ncbi:uncharacterized protein LOC116294227 isoform X2 [Actinia tenebrosa]|uniref:Uncharacterized protein LOC116294227 isoform X2 n=1 Tax=Actinia tenebrosa TaxID=6105 RepID=A0A6P8HRA9_ACTTE|nr:uncharacterized protein LOC116294227 isoform X2 [Actinia tenebrosa]
MIYKKHSNNKDRKEKPGENEMPSSPLEAVENEIPVYASVDLSKKKRTRQHGEKPIHAQEDRSKKKHPGQIIYAELDLLSSTEVIPPPLPDRDAYSEIGCSQSSSHGDNLGPIYEYVFLE